MVNGVGVMLLGIVITIFVPNARYNIGNLLLLNVITNFKRKIKFNVILNVAMYALNIFFFML